ncbi:unnamed protein product [Cercospora beticola]|nr:unnamed protein product [Cercospora beticola]
MVADETCLTGEIEVILRIGCLRVADSQLRAPITLYHGGLCRRRSYTAVTVRVGARHRIHSRLLLPHPFHRRSGYVLYYNALLMAADLRIPAHILDVGRSRLQADAVLLFRIPAQQASLAIGDDEPHMPTSS